MSVAEPEILVDPLHVGRSGGEGVGALKELPQDSDITHHHAPPVGTQVDAEDLAILQVETLHLFSQGMEPLLSPIRPLLHLH